MIFCQVQSHTGCIRTNLNGIMWNSQSSDQVLISNPCCSSTIQLAYNSPLLYQRPAHINYHLFPALFQFGTLFPTLLSLLLILLPLGHMLHPLLVIYMCPYPIHSVLFVYSLIAHTLYVTRVHTLISYIAIMDMYLCIHCYRKEKKKLHLDQSFFHSTAQVRFKFLC